METSRQRSCRDVLLIWLVKVQERVKRVDTFVRDMPYPSKLGIVLQFSYGNLSLMISFPPLLSHHAISACGDVND